MCIRDRYPEGSATIKAWVALTFSATSRSGGKRRDAEEMSRDLAARLPGLGQRLHSTGAGAARPMTAQRLCEAVRVAYEPRAARLIDEAYSDGAVPELSWGRHRACGRGSAVGQLSPRQCRVGVVVDERRAAR